MQAVDGYFADSLFPSCFHQHFSPPWLDAVLISRRVSPPRVARRPFTLIDIGCGDGVGLILLAAAHPEGRFTGIDMMPAHIERGRALIAALGLENVALLPATFQEAPCALDPGNTDYAICNGVLAWVSPANRAAVLRIAAHALKPGGVFAVGYNAMPGWLEIAPFQRAILLLARDATGSSTERFEAAVATARASGAFDTAMWAWFDAVRERSTKGYLPHEYLNEHWQPLWADEVIRPAAALDLKLAGEAWQWRLRPDFALQARWRKTLDDISDLASREAMLDILTHCSFRTDIYVKGDLRKLDDAEQECAQRERFWYAPLPAGQVRYQSSTPAGTIRFDNEAARAIIRLMQHRPVRLRDLKGWATADLLDSLDALFMSRQAAPLDPPVEIAADTINRRVLDFLGGDSRAGVVTPYGVIQAPLPDIVSGRSTLGRRVGLETGQAPDDA